MIIGLTGKIGAGKGVVAEYLMKKSFYYHSLSDVIREEIADEGKEITREALIAKGNELRRLSGPGALAKIVMSKLESDKNYVIDSIRTPGEIEELRKRKDFVLVNVHAPAELRFERIKARGRENDPNTLEAFKMIEAKEAKSTDRSKQQLDECIELADRTLVNDSTIKALHDEVDTLLASLSSEFKQDRPSWDDYFMNIAKTVAARSNCVKRKVGAIIVRDKRILSTGYNGTPRNTTNCNEGGCPRCNSFVDSGTKLEECFCSHGEENAIVQAAYHGISIKGGTVYSTLSPCLLCTKMIINSGILEVVYNAAYPLNGSAQKLLKEAGVKARKVELNQ